MDAERFMDEVRGEIGQRSQLQEGHPSENLLWAYLDGELSPQGRRTVAAHLSSCTVCTEQLEGLRAELEEIETLLASQLGELERAEAKTSTKAKPVWLESLWALLEQLTMPRRLAWHAAAYVMAGAALYGVNSWLHERFGPEPAPLGAPEPAPWWAEWWAPYVLGAWGAFVVAHAVWLLGRWIRR